MKRERKSMSLLPEQFSDLEPWVEAWALRTEAERNRKRLSSSIEDLRAYYDALLPRMEAIFEYLTAFPPEGLPEDAERLLHLGQSFMEVAVAVELYRQPDVPFGYEAGRLAIGQ